MEATNETYQGRRPSSFLKGNVITEVMHLVDRLKKENNTYYRVLLFTSAGALLGDVEPCASEAALLKYTDEPTDFSLDMSSIFNILEKRYKDEDNDYAGPYMLNVKNAILYKSSDLREEVKRIEQMILFSDQIIGFSLIKAQ